MDYMHDAYFQLTQYPTDRCCHCGYFITEKNKHKFIFQQIKNAPFLGSQCSAEGNEHQFCAGTHSAIPIIETEYYVCRNGLRCEARQDKKIEKQNKSVGGIIKDDWTTRF